jgi:hypothetical protein
MYGQQYNPEKDCQSKAKIKMGEQMFCWENNVTALQWANR